MKQGTVLCLPLLQLLSLLLALTNVHSIKDQTVNAKFQLRMYKNESTIDGNFTVDTKRSSKYNYLIWADSGEEVVLQVEGVLLEGYVPPVLNCRSDYLNRLNDLVQSMLISGDKEDKAFSDAVSAIEAIHYFMSRFDSKPSMFYPSRVDTMVAICAETRLLMPMARVKTNIVDPQCIDSGNILKTILEKGSHQYMEDNVVDFMKWGTEHDGTLFMVRLESVMVMERIGTEILKSIGKFLGAGTEPIQPPPKKRRVHFKGISVAVNMEGTSNADVDNLSEMMQHASTEAKRMLFHVNPIVGYGYMSILEDVNMAPKCKRSSDDSDASIEEQSSTMPHGVTLHLVAGNGYQKQYRIKMATALGGLVACFAHSYGMNPRYIIIMVDFSLTPEAYGMKDEDMIDVIYNSTSNEF
ncbi:uncharacterized protein EV420DRAFT_1478271 [Desarmillaria tabescens]|uniref:Uncharacterized protein n=1 Tax=Armillaria tabescens TaxID=1929756 RepID=A0AA39N7K6_ARMTA|nr:uncharacterized protein EV420DRAFT_1478271 [Desarmillaria tabescens]KAK0460493.1 hypothetical protein EV420DRAFT_1478271 [Desarmillaria tabescens]